MGLPLRITFNENDYVYQIIDSKLIDKTTKEIVLLLNGEKVELIRDANLVWKQKHESDQQYDPNLIQALGPLGIPAVEDVNKKAVHFMDDTAFFITAF